MHFSLADTTITHFLLLSHCEQSVRAGSLASQAPPPFSPGPTHTTCPLHDLVATRKAFHPREGDGGSSLGCLILYHLTGEYNTCRQTSVRNIIAGQNQPMTEFIK